MGRLLEGLRPLLWAAAALGSLAVVAGCGEPLAVASLEGSPAEQMDSCVEPTDVMRRRHMDFILHQRDETMHLGIRTEDHSLKGCVDCHTAYNADDRPIPINAEGQFCSSCHVYAAVGIDCFQCHATTPAEKPNLALNGRLDSERSQPKGLIGRRALQTELELQRFGSSCSVASTISTGS
jgi:hypothetical protein